MERARTEWLRARGIDHTELGERHGIALVLTAMSAKFRAPAHLGELLDVTADVVSARGARVVFTQTVTRQGEAGFLCDGTAEVACKDVKSARPRRWPDELLKELQR